MANDDVTIKDLAAAAAAGDLRAGVELVETMTRQGVNVTITTLVAVACPTMRITTAAFDHLQDALDAARLLGDPRR